MGSCKLKTLEVFISLLVYLRIIGYANYHFVVFAFQVFESRKAVKISQSARPTVASSAPGGFNSVRPVGLSSFF